MIMSGVAFPAEIIERIVEEAFSDKLRDDGAWDNTTLPKGFLRLAYVAKAFVYPVRRALYEDLQVDGGEHFLMMVSQLRFCPHLAHFVRTAKLISTCKQRLGNQPGSRDPRPFEISDTPVLWFLEACPRLSELSVTGPDFIAALGSRSIARCNALRRITKVRLLFCDHEECELRLRPGWLAPILRFPALRALEFWEWEVENAVHGTPPGSSSCISLDICTITTRVATASAVRLVRALRRLEELYLEMPASDSAGFRLVVLPAAETLRTLVISDHTLVGSAAGYDPWEVEHIIPQLVQLKVLALNQIPVRPLLLERLPPKLNHLRLTCLDFLPATAVIDWLRKKFQLRSLKILELRGTMRKEDSPFTVEKALPQQMELIKSLCAQHGLEWRYSESPYGLDEEAGLDREEFIFMDDDLGI